MAIIEEMKDVMKAYAAHPCKIGSFTLMAASPAGGCKAKKDLFTVVCQK